VIWNSDPLADIAVLQSYISTSVRHIGRPGYRRPWRGAQIASTILIMSGTPGRTRYCRACVHADSQSRYWQSGIGYRGNALTCEARKCVPVQQLTAEDRLFARRQLYA
jgi:hypothetical protein